MKKILLGLAISLGLVFSSASAATLDNPPTNIKIAQKNGIEIISYFETDIGLDGWVVKNRTAYNIWYSNDSGYVFVGALLDPSGNNLTASYLEELAPKPDYEVMLSKLTYVSTSPNSTSENPVYVFYEPHCGYCSMFHAAAAPYIKSGAEVRWVPVAFLRRDSKPGAPSSFEVMQEILSSSDPLKIIDAHETSKAYNGGKGGLAEGTPATSETFKIAEVNHSVMNELGFSGTPAIVYTDKSGKVVLQKGFPSMLDIASIFSMERMDSADGRLKRFGADSVKYPAK